MAYAQEDRQCKMYNMGKSWHSFDGVAMTFSSQSLPAATGVKRRHTFKGASSPVNGSSKLRRTTSKVLEKMSRLGKRNRTPAEKSFGSSVSVDCVMVGAGPYPESDCELHSSSDEEDRGKDDGWLYEAASQNASSVQSVATMVDVWRPKDDLEPKHAESACSLAFPSMGDPAKDQMELAPVLKPLPKASTPMLGVQVDFSSATSPSVRSASERVGVEERWWTRGSTASLPLVLRRNANRKLSITDEQCHCPACCRCGSSSRLLPHSAEPVSAFATLPRNSRDSCAFRGFLKISRLSDSHDLGAEVSHSSLFGCRSHAAVYPLLRRSSDRRALIDSPKPPAKTNESAPGGLGVFSGSVDEFAVSADLSSQECCSSGDLDVGIDIMNIEDEKGHPENSKQASCWLDGHIVKNRMEVRFLVFM